MAVPSVTVAGFPVLSPAFLPGRPVRTLSSSNWKLFSLKETMKVELMRTKISTQKKIAPSN